MYNMACLTQDVFLCSVYDSPAPEAVIWSVTTWVVKMREIVRHYIFHLMQIWRDFLHNDRPKQHISHGFTLWFWIADIMMGYGPCAVLQTVGYCALSGPVVFCQVRMMSDFFFSWRETYCDLLFQSVVSILP